MDTKETAAARLRRLTMTVDEVAPLLGIHRSTAYEQIRQGAFALPVIRVGRRIVIAKQAVADLLGDEQVGDAA